MSVARRFVASVISRTPNIPGSSSPAAAFDVADVASDGSVDSLELA